MNTFVHQWIPDKFREQDQVEDFHKAVVAVSFLLFLISLGALFLFADLVRGNWRTGFINLFTALLLSGLLVMFHRTANLALTGNLLIGVLFLALGSLSVMDGGFGTYTLIGFIPLPLLAVFLTGKQKGIWWTAAAIAFALTLYGLHVSGLQWKPIQDLGNKYLIFLIYLIAMMVASVSMAVLYESAKNDAFQKRSLALQKLQETNQKLEVTNQHLQEARQEADSASRAKSEFLANMSHEMRTPLNAVIGYSDFLMEEAEDLGYDNIIPDLKRIHVAGKHLLSLINDVLDLSKIEAGRMELHLESYSMNDVLPTVLDTAAPLMEKNNNNLTVDNQLPTYHSYYGDITRLRQIMLNLLSNASKFTQEGEVTLKLWEDEHDAQTWLMFSVTDTGIGISPDHMELLFQKFSQAEASISKRYGGTGLGLALVQSFCALMGGNVSVESELGKGTTFTIRIPARIEDKSATIKLQSSEEIIADITERMARSDSRTLLVIDDDPTDVDLLSRALTREGFKVVTSSRGPEGIRIAKELQPAAIFLDINMPEMDGWEVLTLLKSSPELAHIPVILSSVLDESIQGYNLGASEYLLKPVDSNKLSSILDRYRGSQESYSVLVVDDDAHMRDLFRRTLLKQQCDVKEAINGLEALEMLEQREAEPELIVLDLMMPEMDGFTFIQELRQIEEYQHTPVIVVTAKDLTPEEIQRLQRSVSKILQKDTQAFNQFLTDLRRSFAKRRKAKE